MAVDAKLKVDFHSKGWVISRKIGEGGGGEVYLAYRRAFVDALHSGVMAAQGIGRGQEEQLDLIVSSISTVHDLLLKRQDWAAVLKIAKGNPARTKREIEAMRKCVHPHLTRLIDADPSDRPTWFVMQFHPKGDLQDHQPSYAGRPLDVLRKIRPVVDAVAVMHRYDLIHRDIKARNIFVSESEAWVLGDFGIAYEKGGDRFTEADQTLFSKDWRPDWVAGRKPEDFERTVDVFGLAKVIHYMITGLKVPASQIDEPHADIRKLYPGAPGVDQVHDLLAGHVVAKENQLQSRSATEFATRVDAVLRELSQEPKEALVFSFISTDVGSFVGEREMETLRNLTIRLPHDATRLEFRMRLAGAGSPSGKLTLLNERGMKMAEDSVQFINLEAAEGVGRWSQPYAFRFNRRIPTGWYNLSLDMKVGQSSITGITIVAF